MDRHSNQNHLSIMFNSSALKHDLDPPSSNKSQTVGLLMRLLRVCRILVMLTAGVLVVSCSGDSTDGTAGRVGIAVPPVDLTDTVHAGTRQLLEQQIGIERTGRVAELISDHVGSRYLYVTHRTINAELAEEERRSWEIRDLTDDEREDVRFEIFVINALDNANDTRRGDIAPDSGRMHEAYVAGLEECASDYGITNFNDMMRPSVEDLPSPADRGGVRQGVFRGIRR